MATDGAGDWPAWIQAIGSVAGIAIAVAVPAYQTWTAQTRERQERRSKALALAMMLSPNVESLHQGLEQVALYADEAFGADDTIAVNDLTGSLTGSRGITLNNWEDDIRAIRERLAQLPVFEELLAQQLAALYGGAMDYQLTIRRFKLESGGDATRRVARAQLDVRPLLEIAREVNFQMKMLRLNAATFPLGDRRIFKRRR
ncbi:hypothetical protein [Niveispirillum sp. KHB5.9]|uniref:hypothetical protein n=1 Tax=Niveispirillum sp. KHB5.9 TaxID=3400269 RepID=UPI003A84CBA7